MSCDTRARPGQSLSERKIEVREAVAKLAAALVSGRVKPVIGAQGAIAFPDWTEGRNARVTDACAYRLIMSTGSALAKAAIARAEQLAGRVVDARVIMHGAHSHDGGVTWHNHRG